MFSSFFFLKTEFQNHEFIIMSRKNSTPENSNKVIQFGINFILKLQRKFKDFNSLQMEILHICEEKHAFISFYVEPKNE